MVAPMTTYLVGLDGSEHARDALDWARAVATQEEKVVVLHANDLPIVTGLEIAATVDPTESDEVSREFVAGTLGDLADPRLDGRVMTGPPGEALVEAAQQFGPDVVIVVGHGGTGKVSLLLGSTAHHVVHHTDHPVVVVRGELRIPVRRVYVGIDEPGGHDELDAHSLAALRWAVRVPGVEQVEVAHADFVPGVAAGPVREPGLESDEATADDDAQIHRAITAATDGTGTAPSGAAIVPVVAAGTGAFALIEASREVDLVVVGTRGRSGLVELIVGSTTLEVLAHAHCAVAVIR
jgi:nucleotide-binding universal stress UspA family protein